jgi:RNA polymerase sigma-70 factor (ECF subfamily)
MTSDALLAHHRRFLDFLERQVGNRADAEDILQSAFARGLGPLEAIDDEDRAVRWFYRVLRNAVVDHFRRRRAEERARAAFLREIGEALEPPPEIAAELCRCVEALLPALPAAQQEILRQVDLEDIRPADFARQHGLTTNAAMVRLHRARKALREALERSCRTCAEHGCLDCGCGVRAREVARL